MLLVASDVSTEVYYYRITDAFCKSKQRDRSPQMDEESWVQLFSAPLCLGYYAICERTGESFWDSPQEGMIYYRKSSDLVLLIIQNDPDELVAIQCLDLLAELIEVSGRLK